MALIGTFLLALASAGPGGPALAAGGRAGRGRRARSRSPGCAPPSSSCWPATARRWGSRPFHAWKPDAYGEAPGLLGALLSGGVTAVAFVALVRVLRVCEAGGAGSLRAAGVRRDRRPVARAGRRLRRRAARLQADARLLERRAHGHPRARDRRSAAPPRPAPSSTSSPTASRRGCSSSPPGTSTARSARSGPRSSDGAARVLPFSGPVFLAAFLAITGSPPFAPFFSEFAILAGAVKAGRLRPRPRRSSSASRSSSSGWGRRSSGVVQGAPPEELQADPLRRLAPHRRPAAAADGGRPRARPLGAGAAARGLRGRGRIHRWEA